MRRLLPLFALILMLASPLAAIAQDATPDTAGNAAFGVPLGTAVPWIGADGNPIGSISIDDMVDPFTEQTGGAPQRGYHYVLLTATFTNDSAAAAEVNGSAIYLVDSEGFVYSNTWIEHDTSMVPDLEYTDALATGESMTGAVAFEVYDGATIDRVIYNPSYDRVWTLVDLRTDGVDAGTPVQVIAENAAPMLEVSVDGIEDPFTAFDAANAPTRGSRLVAVTLTATNVGSTPVSPNSWGVTLVDAQGFAATATFLFLSDPAYTEFSDDELAPGASVTGTLFFELVGEIPVVQILYVPSYTQNFVLADFGEGSPTGTVGASATKSPLGPVAGKTVAADSQECADVQAWAEEIAPAMGDFTTAFDSVDLENPDPVALRDAADSLSQAADAVRNSNPPALAEDFATSLVTTFDALAETLNDIADAAESGDTKAMGDAIGAMMTIALEMDGGDLTTSIADLEAACPSLSSALDS